MPGPIGCRRIGMGVLFIGFALFYRSCHYPTPQGTVDGFSWPLFLLSLAVVAGANVWIFKTVRCPCCGRLLGPKGSIAVCRHCGARIR